MNRTAFTKTGVPRIFEPVFGETPVRPRLRGQRPVANRAPSQERREAYQPAYLDVAEWFRAATEALWAAKQDDQLVSDMRTAEDSVLAVDASVNGTLLPNGLYFRQRATGEDMVESIVKSLVFVKDRCTAMWEGSCDTQEKIRRAHAALKSVMVILTPGYVPQQFKAVHNYDRYDGSKR